MKSNERSNPPITLQDIINTSGDSTSESSSFNDGILMVNFLHGELDQRIHLQISTNVIYSNHRAGSHNNTFYISTIELKKRLLEKNGVFVPHIDFTEFMRESRDFLNLAYGLRSSQYGLLISFIGDFHLATIVTGIDKISFKIIQ